MKKEVVLKSNFFYEFIKKCLNDENFYKAIKKFIEYEYFPSAETKHIWKKIKSYYEINSKLPTIGIISQSLNNSKIDEILEEVKTAKIVEKNDLKLEIEYFIKTSVFKQKFNDLSAKFNDSEDMDKIILELSKVSFELSNLRIFDNIMQSDKIFEEYKKRANIRKIDLLTKKNDEKNKITTGIDELDFIMDGGLDFGDMLLFLGMSGFGKTKFLRWIGVSASRLGFKVLHIQAEGTKEECLDGYDATWTGIKIKDLEEVNVRKMEKIENTSKKINNIGGEIYVHCFEQFSEPKVSQIYDLYLNFKEKGINIDLILLDYFELFAPDDFFSKRGNNGYERERRRELSRQLKNITNIEKIRVVTATQASDVNFQYWNDKDFVLTRNNISEFKNCVEPFTTFLTLNRTVEERRNKYMRIYVEKMRNYDSDIIINICTDFENDRFYDRKKTIANFIKNENE